MEQLTSTFLKDYELLEQIGSGGFGAVYRAYQSMVSGSIGREVAIKVILPEYASQPDFIRRFETEAQFVANLEHMNITPLYDYWRDPHGAYIVMRYLRGGSLKDTLASEPYDLEAAAYLLDQVTSALSIAHRNHVIHRDIKPANILLDEDGNAYLADFGIAKDVAKVKNGHTVVGDWIGTPDYSSPEQIRGEDVTPQSDIYSLGIVLYETLTGSHPFPKASSVERLFKHLEEAVPEIKTLTAYVSEAINAVVQKATAKNPQHRYPDVLALAAAFREAAALTATHVERNLVELLTPREQEVLKLIVEGKSNREIAEALTVEVSTVKWYVRQIYSKLNVRSRVQAVVRARELELIVNGRSTGKTAATGLMILPPLENPYKGLQAFQMADEQDFFGREKLTEKLLARLESEGADGRFLAIVGPSGSGKSSLVKAGLIPALWRGELPGSERWFITDLIPGMHPLDQLEVALIKIATHHPDSIHEQLVRDERGLVRAAQIILPDDNSELVVVIDQFEEVFSLVEAEERRVHFLDLLRTAVQDPQSRIRVILTLRADFYDRPLQYPTFGELVRSYMETVLPLSAEELEQAIVGPAQRVGIEFEEGLVASIVSDVNYQPGALPLLQYALTELFEARQERLLTHGGYQQIGRAAGALARRAEQIYAELDETGQELVRQMFLRLVTLGEGSEDTRRRVTHTELLAIADDPLLMDEVIDVYADYRLLALDHDPSTRTPTAEVAHEAILREWERLRQWLNDSRADIRLQRQLARAAQEWQQAEADDSFLLRGTRLTTFEKWVSETEVALTILERRFLTRSLSAREERLAEEAERQQREEKLERRSQTVLRALVMVFAVAALVATGLTIFAFSQRNTAQMELARAERIRLAAQAQLALDRGEDVIIPALLALQSLEYGYSAEADAALLRAMSRGFARQQYVGHDDALVTAEFSPDGRYVLTAANDATIRLWDTQTGEEIRQFIGHTELVNLALFSPDGELILSGSADRTVRLWDTETGEEIGRLPDHNSPIWMVAFAPDGEHVLTSDESGTAWLWHIATAEVVQTFQGHSDVILWSEFAADGHAVATGSIDRTARLWDVATGEEVRQFVGHSGSVSSVQVSPDGRYLLTASYDNTARLWDIATSQELRTFIGHTNILGDANFSPDGQLVVTSSRDKTARLWDVTTGQELRRFLGHTAAVDSARFSPDGRYILTSSVDRTARLWDIYAENEPRVLSLPLRTLHSTTMLFIDFAQDNQQIIMGMANGDVLYWHSQTGQILTLTESKLDPHAFLNDMTLSADATLAATASGDGMIRLWDWQTRQEIYTFTGHTGPIWDIQFAPDGGSLLTGGDDQTARLWDVQTGRERLAFVGHSGAVNGVAFAPDGRTALTGSQDGTARLWEVATGVEVRQFVGHGGSIRGVAFAPNGRQILTSSDDATVRLWDIQTGQEIRQFVGHTDSVWPVAFSPDGQQVLTGSDDQTARLWDIDTGLTIRQFVGHEVSVRSLAFAADGKQIITADFTDAYLWRTDLDTIISEVCTQLPRDFSDEERTLYSISDDRPTCPP